MALRIFIVWKEEAPPLPGVSVRQERWIPRAALWTWNPEPGDLDRAAIYAREHGYRVFIVDAPEDALGSEKEFRAAKEKALDYAEAASNAVV